LLLFFVRGALLVFRHLYLSVLYTPSKPFLIYLVKLCWLTEIFRGKR
jgi:hypothetical protein